MGALASKKGTGAKRQPPISLPGPCARHPARLSLGSNNSGEPPKRQWPWGHQYNNTPAALDPIQGAPHIRRTPPLVGRFPPPCAEGNSMPTHRLLIMVSLLAPPSPGMQAQAR